MHDVFVSYSSKNRSDADAICRALEERGIRCWIAPRSILPGENYAASIIAAIGNSRAMVLVFSAAANSSRSVLNEVERAFNKDVPIYPIRIENVQATGGFEFFLSMPQWYDAFGSSLVDHLEGLVDAIAASLFAATVASDARPTADATPELELPNDRPAPEQIVHPAEQLPMPADNERPHDALLVPSSAPQDGEDPSLEPVSRRWTVPRILSELPEGVVVISISSVLILCAVAVWIWFVIQTETRAREMAASRSADYSRFLSPYDLSVKAAVDAARSAESRARAIAVQASGAQAQARIAASRAYAIAKARGKREITENGYTVHSVYESDASKERIGTYAGQVTGSGDTRDGFGVMTENLGERYEGAWSGDSMQGLGIYRYPGGGIYSGQQTHDQDNGLGVETCGPKDACRETVGEWVADEFSGYGVLYSKDGTIMLGHWKAGNLDGFGAKLDVRGDVTEQGRYEDGSLKVNLGRPVLNLKS